jgi:hypothetical protein
VANAHPSFASTFEWIVIDHHLIAPKCEISVPIRVNQEIDDEYFMRSKVTNHDMRFWSE